MSQSYIPVALRRLVINRADSVCEYCLIHEDDTFFRCQIDHIISEKHGGLTEGSNLALSCTYCNLHKGSDIASLSEQGELTRLFNPRTDQWKEHFVLEGAVIVPATAIGEVTIALLKLNMIERLLERQALIDVGAYPGREI